MAQPTAEQNAAAAISKSAADPLSANVATLENPKGLQQRFLRKKVRGVPGGTFPPRESPPSTAAGDKSITFSLHGEGRNTDLTTNR